MQLTMLLVKQSAPIIGAAVAARELRLASILADIRNPIADIVEEVPVLYPLQVECLVKQAE
jgi:hypothetical protein